MFRDDFAVKSNGFFNVSELEQSLEGDEAGRPSAQLSKGFKSIMFNGI